MSVYHQMGHDSINLVKDEDLKQFTGMVCSPVNYTETQVKDHIASLGDGFISILDPQLYYPRSIRSNLRDWGYFPNDFDTADSTNFYWWKEICNKLIDTCEKIEATHVCSPCMVPTKFNSEYYKFYVDIGNCLYRLTQQREIGFFQTAIIDYNTIKDPGEVEMIASILSQTDGDSVYLFLRTDVEPRRELTDSDSLSGVMKLIRLLKGIGINVFFGFCSSEFVLWKYAGAEMFATGKFFNLRRFTSSRFDEPPGNRGRGQLPYWFEMNLMAYLREGDLVRLHNEKLLHPDYIKNPYALAILNHLKKSPDTPWVSLSWKNYLYTFARIEMDLKVQDIRQLLINAENNWKIAEDRNILMEEVRNDGSWIRPWRIAINSFEKEFK